MAREMVILDWCDPCSLKDEPLRVAAARSVEFTQSGSTKIIDVCEACDKELIQPVEHLLRLARRTDQAPKKAPKSQLAKQPTKTRAPLFTLERPGSKEPVTCPACGKTVSGMKGILNHAATSHGFTAAKNCPDCDWDGADDARGTASHRRGKHGFDPYADVMEKLAAVTA